MGCFLFFFEKTVIKTIFSYAAFIMTAEREIQKQFCLEKLKSKDFSSRSKIIGPKRYHLKIKLGRNNFNLVNFILTQEEKNTHRA